MNPLETDKPYTFSMANPNPTSSKTKNGPVYRVSFELEKEDWSNFMDANTDGMVIDVAAQVTHKHEEKSSANRLSQPKKKKGEYGRFARDLKLSNFFRTPEVWKAMGTDEEFKEWIQNQPSCVSGKQDLIEYSNEFKCEAAHVRRSDESGMGYKADYACVPLTHEEHQDQHINGERVCLNIHIGHNKWADLKKYQGEFEAAKAWFDKQRIKYVSQWCWDTLKNDFQVESMSELSPNTIMAHFDSLEVAKFLPQSIKDAA